MSALDPDIEKVDYPLAQTPSLRQRTLSYERNVNPNLQPVSPYPTQTEPLSHPLSRTTSSNNEGEENGYSEETLTATNTQASVNHPEYMRRVATHHSVYLGTVGSKKCCKEGKLLPFGGGKPYPPQLPGREQYVVEFEGREDPLHGQNWKVRTKLLMGALLTYETMIVTFTSSVISPSLLSISHKYHLGLEPTTLSVSLFILGFASGPILWAPISELKGRRLPLLLSGFLFSTFSIAVATAEDIQTILICRFWAGFCGACPIAISPAVLSDIFGPYTRGLAVTIFGSALFCGTLMGPFVGGFIELNEGLGWRWTSYIPSILGYSSFTLNVLFLKETYPPLILCAKAAELRRRTLNWGIHAKQEEVEVDFHELIQKNFGRPLKMLFTEPIVFLISVYLSLLYSIVFIFFAAYSVVFQQNHGMNAGVGNLPLLAVAVGILLGAGCIAALNPAYGRRLRANDEITVPEWRCPPAMVGGVCFAAGLFWFGWTGHYHSVHWAVPMVSGLLTGFGIMMIFLPMLNYLVDAYLVFAASAVAANTMMRSALAASCPLFARYMFKTLGVNWGMTLIGCFAACLIPIPFWFYFCGETIRRKSKFAPTYD